MAVRRFGSQLEYIQKNPEAEEAVGIQSEEEEGTVLSLVFTSHHMLVRRSHFPTFALFIGVSHQSHRCIVRQSLEESLRRM
jgi:hypothetical protein